MSKTYRCRVKKDIRETHRTADTIELKISLLDILDPKEMEGMYRKALKDTGAKENADGTLELKVDGVTVTVDPKEKTAVGRVEGKKDIEIHVDKEVQVYNIRDNEKVAQAMAEKKVADEIAADVANKKKELEEKVKSTLDAAEEKVKEKLREAANEAHKAALRKKADRMGKVTVNREEELGNGDKRLTLEIELG
jgi:hypothetical protein